MRSTLFTLTAACHALTHAALAQAPSRVDLRNKLVQCQVAEGAIAALCGHFPVPEVRGTPNARTISLNIVLLPALTNSVADDALVFLAGGGVVPATRYARFLTRALSALRQQHDILLVDQRGTWNSNPLSCELAERPGLPRGDDAAEARRCATFLMQRADLRAYSTESAMADLDAVRAWLGYSTVSLYGVSYGTKAAQVYLKEHPDRVRSAVLYGVVPLAASTQLDLARFAQESLQRVFARCASDEHCHAAFPRLATEFDSVLARLQANPATYREAARDSAAGVPITDRLLRNVVQEMLGSARSIEQLPWLIHSAYDGDYAPIARAVTGEGPPPPPPAPRGIFLSILCAESIVLVDSAAVTGATAGSFFGEAPVRSQMNACAQWPLASLSAEFWKPTSVNVPVLAVTGDLDPITPPAYGEMVTSHLGNARHLVLPNRSHGDVDPCITSLFEAFLLSGGTRQLDTSCAEAVAPLQFVIPPRSLPRF